MKKGLHVYAVMPIDFWQGWLTKDQYLKLTEDEPHGESVKAADERLTALVESAGTAARRMGWEGDYRQGPYFSTIPSADYESETLVAWKQDNNGTTFIASPYPLPWLNQ